MLGHQFGETLDTMRLYITQRPPSRAENFINLMKLVTAFKNNNFHYTREEKQAQSLFVTEFRRFIEADTCLFEAAMGHFKHMMEVVPVLYPGVDRDKYWNFQIKEGGKTITAQEERVGGTMMA